MQRCLIRPKKAWNTGVLEYWSVGVLGKAKTQRLFRFTFNIGC